MKFFTIIFFYNEIFTIIFSQWNFLEENFYMILEQFVFQWKFLPRNCVAIEFFLEIFVFGINFLKYFLQWNLLQYNFLQWMFLE